jgi:hypothetical protein
MVSSEYLNRMPTQTTSLESNVNEKMMEMMDYHLITQITMDLSLILNDLEED